MRLIFSKIWPLMIVAVLVVVLVAYVRDQASRATSGRNKRDDSLGAAIGICLCLGTGLGIIVDQLAIGAGIGLLMGVLIGSFYDRA